jgi:hypothetical protein
MPKNPRPGKRGIYFEMPEELAARLAERVAQERRPQTTVLIMAVEQYLGRTTKPKGKKASDG